MLKKSENISIDERSISNLPNIKLKVKNEVLMNISRKNYMKNKVEQSPMDNIEDNTDENSEVEAQVEVEAEAEENAEVSNETSEVEAQAIEPSPEIATISWTEEILKDNNRHFNIDLMPKVLYSGGFMVNLLISSDVAKYLEFKVVTQIITSHDNIIKKVPCSKSDIFNSKEISVIEKRRLMKFMQFALKYETQPEIYSDFQDRPFSEFLKAQQLTDIVQSYILHNIAMVDEEVDTIFGLNKTVKFMNSLNRYGNGAFLWPLYGAGELSQAFCRFSAVFGGTFCLKHSLSEINFNESNEVVSVIDDQQQTINCKWLIMNHSYVPKQLLNLNIQRSSISRAILFTDKQLFSSADNNGISVINFPASSLNVHRIQGFEVTHSAMVCPTNLWVVYLNWKTVKSADTDIELLINHFFDLDATSEITTSSKPKLLHSIFYDQVCYSESSRSSTCPTNLIISYESSNSFDLDESTIIAKNLFRTICPDEEFLPKAPNPEDIIFDSN